jgi:hypothetical protein
MRRESDMYTELKTMDFASLLRLERGVAEELSQRKSKCGEMYAALENFTCREYEANGRIPAINFFRDLTGTDLKGAKDQVESWAKSRNWEAPAEKSLFNPIGNPHDGLGDYSR